MWRLVSVGCVNSRAHAGSGSSSTGGNTGFSQLSGAPVVSTGSGFSPPVSTGATPTVAVLDSSSAVESGPGRSDLKPSLLGGSGIGGEPLEAVI